MQPTTPAPQQSAVNTAETSASAAAPPAPPAVDPRAEIDQLASDYGFDPGSLAGFTDPASAREAVRVWVDQTARGGLSTGYAPPQPPQYPGYPQTAPGTAAPVQVGPNYASTAAPSFDLKALGLEADDPAGKAIMVLESRLAKSEQIAQQVATQLNQFQEAGREQAKQALKQEAQTVVSSFQSPKYGTSTNRSASQEMAVQRLYDLADAIAVGAYNRGGYQAVPPLRVRLAQARLLDDQQFGGPGMVQPAATPAPPQTSALPSFSPPPAGAGPQMKITDRWSDNPELLALVSSR
jgi:hypothetical protein